MQGECRMFYISNQEFSSALDTSFNSSTKFLSVCRKQFPFSGDPSSQMSVPSNEFIITSLCKLNVNPQERGVCLQL